MNWEWVPGRNCGEFQLGVALASNTYTEPVVRLPPSCDGADWVNYRVGNEEARVRVENGIIVGVECVRSLLLHGQEIIGLQQAELGDVLGRSPEVAQRWDDGSARLEVPELGLTLWLESGVVESATVEAAITRPDPDDLPPVDPTPSRPDPG
jgi:hypothetical protein